MNEDRRPSSSTYYVTPHALDRFQEHHPGALFPAAMQAIVDGLEVERFEVLRFIKRGWSDDSAFHVITRDFRGCFVMKPQREPGKATGVQFVAVTYLRLDDDVSRDMEKRCAKRMGYPYDVRHYHHISTMTGVTP